MEHQTLYFGDCLDWMREWPDESADLIYLDPPFNSNANYNILYGRSNGAPAQVRAFTDTWRWDEAAAGRLERIQSAVSHPAHRAVTGFGMMLGPSGMLAYLTYMAERLPEMRRLLKPAGSIYYHCDDTAGHYLKVLLDDIFGTTRYRGNIIWRRATAHNDARRFGRIVDHILFYAKDDRPYWDGYATAAPKSPEELKEQYPSQDDRGRYRTSDLTGATVSGGPSGQPWRDYNVTARNRHWAPPLTGRYAEYIEDNFIPGYRDIANIHQRLDALDAAGLIHHPGEGGVWPGLKRYAAADLGRRPQNLILAPTGFTNFSARRGEYLGYQTQKPVGLLEQLIPPACPEGGLVLDPFCGCGTTVIAAHNLNRRWAGIDIATTALDIIQEQRLAPMGIQANMLGIPADLASARRLAADRPFSFEIWAVTRIPGLVPNERQRRDGGIDGRGMMLSRPRAMRSRLTLAQAKGGAFVLSQFRDFLHVVNSNNAALGIYITLEPVTSRAARAEAAALGSVSVGAAEYPRVQFWSIRDYFDGRQANLPVMADPNTGRAMQPPLA